MTGRRCRFAALATVACGVCLVARPSAAISDAQGSQLAAACASCHRPDGRDASIPPIAGVGENRIVQMMLTYRSEERGSQIMHVVAGALSPEEITAVAHYISSRWAVERR